jgi:PPM family protein phosphatase
MIHVRWGLVSITGNFRDNNEDKGFADEHGCIFLVADGMGGQAAGEKASELAISHISNKLRQALDFASDPSDKVRRCIDDSIGEANIEIMALGDLDPQYTKMGTTIVFLVKVGEKVYVGGIGDSRVYRLRDGKLEQLTTDHSLTQALVDAGTITPEEALTHRYRNVLYRYLGTKEGGNGADVKELTPEKGDRFLLCSDGVSDGLGLEPMIALMKQHTDSQEAAEAIVKAAADGGSKDNITCLIIDID